MFILCRKQSWAWLQGDTQRQRQKEIDRGTTHRSYSHMLTAVDDMKINDISQDTVISENNNNMEISCDGSKSKVSCLIIYHFS